MTPDDISEADLERFGNFKILQSIDDGMLNLWAWLAISGLRSDRSRDLENLFRSEVPIHRLVRDELANAFAGNAHGGVRFEIHGGGEKRDHVAGVEARRRWVMIGEWIEDQIKAGALRKDAIVSAAATFAASVEKCEQALTYTRTWKQQVADAGGSQLVAQAYHSWDFIERRKKRGRKPRGSALPKQ